MLGGGSKHFINQTMTEHGISGKRMDGRNLTSEWLSEDPGRTYVNTKAQLMAVDHNEVKQLLGIFNSDHLNYWIDVERDKTQDLVPSLTEMTMKAIDILDRDKDGYFLLVEGGRIDHAHHGTEAKQATGEVTEFSRAIQNTLDRVNLNDTLIVVTADHGHVMTISGYAERGHNIFGIAGEGTDGLPYMTISYANGRSFPKHVKDGKRIDPTILSQYIDNINTHEFPVTVARKDETHGGEDVGIWSIGPWSHLFQGTLEQNVIPHIMAYASCVGDGLKACDNQ